jgi:hypothetical protein
MAATLFVPLAYFNGFTVMLCSVTKFVLVKPLTAEAGVLLTFPADAFKVLLIPAMLASV